MAERTDRYRAFAAICARVDYASRRSVREHNQASEQMRALVGEAYQAGPAAVAELIPLLDEPTADEWLAFQLLDLGQPPVATVERCLAIIRRKAAGSGPEAMGAEMWLRDWQTRHAEPGAAADGGGK
jgi:hypothetical protein